MVGGLLYALFVIVMLGLTIFELYKFDKTKKKSYPELFENWKIWAKANPKSLIVGILISISLTFMVFAPIFYLEGTLVECEVISEKGTYYGNKWETNNILKDKSIVWSKVYSDFKVNFTLNVEEVPQERKIMPMVLSDIGTEKDPLKSLICKHNWIRKWTN